MNAQDAASFLERGKGEYGVGDYKAALQHFTDALRLQPGLKDANYYAGMAEFNLKDYQQAIVYFKKEKAADPENQKVIVILARAESEAGETDAAIGDLTALIEKDKNNATLYLERGNVWFNKKDYKKALDDYTASLALNTKLEQAYYKKGFCNYYLKDTVAACESWSKLEDPDDFEHADEMSKICTTYVKK